MGMNLEYFGYGSCISKERQLLRVSIMRLKKRWFLKVELAVLVCVICIWVVKLATIDIDSTKAAVFKQAKIPATRKKMTP